MKSLRGIQKASWRVRSFSAAALLVACGTSNEGVGASRNVENGAGSASTPLAISAPLNPFPVTVAIPMGSHGGNCQREVTLQTVLLEDPRPFDLVIVADHSDSLAWSKDELTAGLRGLLSNVKGRAVRVFLLTPTQYGAYSAAAHYPLSESSVVAWKDPATGVAYENAVTNYVQTCKDLSGEAITCPGPTALMPYTLHGEWQFVMPEPVAVLTPELSDAEFEAEQAALADAIVAIGGTGSPNEQPLCTLSRYVSQPAAELPENVVLLVISDEDDVSKPDDCLLTLDGDVHNAPMTQTNEMPCTSACDSYRYQMNGNLQQSEHAFTCAAFSDTGSMIPGSEQMLTFASARTCDNGAPSPCGDQDKATAQMYCPTGLSLTTCNTSCATRPTVCSVELTQPMTTPCASPFTYAGTSYKDLPDYCQGMGTGWENCEVYGTKREVVTNMVLAVTNSHQNLMLGSTSADVARYFTTKRAMAFAAGKSLLEGILLTPNFNCPLGAGQSYATNLESVIADPKHVFALCEPYAPALGSVVDFAQTLLQTEYTLTLKADEQVTAVVVTGKDGTERALEKTDYTFTVQGGSLSISETALRGTDANLRVEVTSDCRPILN